MSLDDINRRRLIDVIQERMITSTHEITTSGGEQTRTYLDIPHVLRDKTALNLASRVLFMHLVNNDLSAMTVVGGPTTGAIPLVIGVTMCVPSAFVPDLEWFIVRDTVKTHGLGRLFVGAEPGPQDKVVLVDDVISTGVSLQTAFWKIAATGAEVIAVVPLVDRSGVSDLFDAPYLPVLTYDDVGIPPLFAAGT